MIEYGLQLYSVRDITGQDLKGALRQVAELGYSFVEFAGFFGNSGEDVKEWLEEYRLKVSGTHTGCDAITPDKIQETIDYHKAIGCTSLIVPGARYAAPEDLEYTVGLFKDAQEKLAAEGISLGYHNHSKEFYSTSYGKIVEEEFINRTDVELEIDTFWLFNAGIDPVPYLEAHKDRIRMIHHKDGKIPTNAVRNFDTAHDGVMGTSLGGGMAPVKAVRDWAIANKVLMVVESEGLDPSGIEEVKRCIEFLRSLET